MVTDVFYDVARHDVATGVKMSMASDNFDDPNLYFESVGALAVAQGSVGALCRQYTSICCMTQIFIQLLDDFSHDLLDGEAVAARRLLRRVHEMTQQVDQADILKDAKTVDDLLGGTK